MPSAAVFTEHSNRVHRGDGIGRQHWEVDGERGEKEDCETWDCGVGVSNSFHGGPSAFWCLLSPFNLCPIKT